MRRAFLAVGFAAALAGLVSTSTANSDDRIKVHVVSLHSADGDVRAPCSIALRDFRRIRDFVDMLREGVGASNDAAGSFGPPRFDHDRFIYSGRVKAATVHIRYH